MDIIEMTGRDYKEFKEWKKCKAPESSLHESEEPYKTVVNNFVEIMRSEPAVREIALKDLAKYAEGLLKT